MGGDRVADELLSKLPDASLRGSPSLLRLSSASLLSSGRYEEAAALIADAVKLYASLGDSRSMLSLLAQWSLLHRRLGLEASAGPPLLWLEEEWKRNGYDADGYLPWALARNAVTNAGDADGLFDSAVRRFARDGEWAQAAWVLLDRRFYDPSTFGSDRWREWRMELIRWSAMEKACRAARRLLDNLSEPLTDNVLGDPSFNEALPERYVLLAEIELWRLRLSDPIRERETLRRLAAEWGSLEERWKSFESDVELCLYFERLRWKRNVMLHEPDLANNARKSAELLQPWVGSPASVRCLEEMTSMLPRPADKKDRDAAPVWHISLFGSITLSREGQPPVELSWKRQKSKELFVYLLLQHRYRAAREQVLADLFGDGEPHKMHNQLHVAMFDCRQTLKAAGWHPSVFAGNGIVGIREQDVASVDLERFTVLFRVSRQLWKEDREQADAMMSEAVSLYGKLASDVQHADWLDRQRVKLAEQLSAMMVRLARIDGGGTDSVEVERLLLQWIDWLPEQEEAYRQLIELLVAQSRRAEAVRWYRRLERVCREQLETTPAEETRKLLWP